MAGGMRQSRHQRHAVPRETPNARATARWVAPVAYIASAAERSSSRASGDVWHACAASFCGVGVGGVLVFTFKANQSRLLIDPRAAGTLN